MNLPVLRVEKYIFVIVLFHLVYRCFVIVLFDLEQKSCNNAEDECLHYKSLYERSQQELTDLAEKHKQVLNEYMYLS